MMISSIELFSGVGGLALDLHQAGFEYRALLERDGNSCDTVGANTLCDFLGIQKWRVVQADVRLVNYSNYGSDIQVVSEGLPCQPCSLGGKHKARNDARDIFPEAVREIRLEGFIFENVKGLIRKSFSTYFNYILLQLTHPEIIMRDGMDWAEHLRFLEQQHTSGRYSGLTYNTVFRLFNAADYGVPQTRHRVVIVGFRNNLDANWSFPEATHSKEAPIYSKFKAGSMVSRKNQSVVKPFNPLDKQNLDESVAGALFKRERPTIATNAFYWC